MAMVAQGCLGSDFPRAKTVCGLRLYTLEGLFLAGGQFPGHCPGGLETPQNDIA